MSASDCARAAALGAAAILQPVIPRRGDDEYPPGADTQKDDCARLGDGGRAETEVVEVQIGAALKLTLAMGSVEITPTKARVGKESVVAVKVPPESSLKVTGSA